MRYQLLGHSGLRVSQLCLGAMTFGEEFGIGAPAEECRRVFDAYLAAGGNFIDTANIYNAGTSERMLADFIRSGRDRLVLASKYTLSTAADDPNAGGSHRKNLVQALEASLRRLDTPYLDLYWVHGWDAHTPVDALMRALDDQVRLGKILHIGISNVPAWAVAQANTLATERGWTPFTALQLHYNLVERGIEADFFALARALGLSITAWSPLASGLLTGKYLGGDGKGRLARGRGGRPGDEHKQAAAQRLKELAAEAGCSPAQLAIAWICQRDPLGVIPILGARNAEQLADNLGATALVLTPEQLKALDSLAPPTLRYPENMLGGDFFRNMMYGRVREQVRWPARG